MDKFPFPWEELTPEENESIKKHFPFYTQLVKYLPSNCVLPKKFTSLAEKIYNMEVRKDDVWILTYPKCGTTWTQEMTWQILNNVDMEKGKMPLFVRSPFLELGAFQKQEKDKPILPIPKGTEQEVSKMLDGIRKGRICLID